MFFIWGGKLSWWTIYFNKFTISLSETEFIINLWHMKRAEGSNTVKTDIFVPVHANRKNTIAFQIIRIVFNKQTTPINATFPAKVPCKVKTTAQTYIWFSNSDWIILALGNCEDPQKITKKICSFDSLAGTNKRTPLPASFRFWWRTQLNPMNAYQTRKYLRLFDVLLACTLWDFQNRIVIGHVFV